MFADLFTNLCIIISVSFIYLQLRWKVKLDERLQRFVLNIIDGLAGGILGLILLHYSIQTIDMTIIDLRYTPIILIVLFSGIYPGVISGLVIITGRFIINVNHSTYMALASMIIILIGFVIIERIFKGKQLASYKQGIPMIFYSNIAFTVIISITISEREILLSMLPVYWLISTIGGVIAIFFIEYVLRSQYLLDKYERESTTDFLTGLNNVRQFDTIWNSLVKEAIQKNERLSLLAIDIDFFKKVNDTYGHAAGDLVLAELGKVLKHNARSFDIVSRNGGEEFSVILPDCQNNRAVEIAEQIRSAVESHAFPISSTETIFITISIGVATYPETVEIPDNMPEIADECLYEAKRTGRNRVCADI